MRQVTNHHGFVIAHEAENEGERDALLRCVLEGSYRADDLRPGTTFEPGDEEMVPAMFSLICENCNFDGPDSREAAAREGWQDVRFTPWEPSCNYSGACPRCHKLLTEVPSETQTKEQAARQGPAQSVPGGGATGGRRLDLQA